MSRIIISCLLLLSTVVTYAQINELSDDTKQALEILTEGNDDVVTEDDSYLQALQQLSANPVNLNTAEQEDLEQLQLLTPLQIQAVLDYRRALGPFTDIYELQAVPMLDIATIQKIRPFIKISDDPNVWQALGARLQGGSHTVLLRTKEVLEKAKGYLLNSNTAKNYYPGSPQSIFIRYQYAFKNTFQYGFLGKKDAGEQFFKGAQSKGFDFYAAHLYAKDIGIIKVLAIGDFTVNMGQGLVQWQSLAFKKGADVINIKRQAPVLLPYNAAGEVNFHRGAGITLGRRYWQATAFISYRKMDANFNADTLEGNDFISSLETSGYHRTQNEIEDKGALHQSTIGANVSLNPGRFHLGFNTVRYHFNIPLEKSAHLYNLFALAGKDFGNSSMDYSFTIRNCHFFGEAAVDSHWDKAFINGVLICLDAKADMSFLYRNLDKRYQSLYTNAFTENTYPSNERGFYSAISLHPDSRWRLDGYADYYSFPWLKYQVNAPSSGRDYSLQMTYTPDKQLSIYSHYKNETKAANNNTGTNVLTAVSLRTVQNWRTSVQCKISPSITLCNRVEMVWFRQQGLKKETGCLFYTDVSFRPAVKKKTVLNLRWQYFETASYNSRLYSYEDDVLYSYTVPVFFGKGIHYYLNLEYHFSKYLACWLHIAQTVYSDQSSIGSSLDMIAGNKKTALALQGIYRF